MKTYLHTQRGTLILAVLIGMAVIGGLLSWVYLHQLWIVTPILLLTALLFHSLTIEIADGELRWRFGLGLIRKRVVLADITSARPVRTNFAQGWGIHYSRFGWLYNVSGFDAVAITLRSGRRFALGTDEPETLARHLAAAISTR